MGSQTAPPSVEPLVSTDKQPSSDVSFASSIDSNAEKLLSEGPADLLVSSDNQPITKDLVPASGRSVTKQNAKKTLYTLSSNFTLYPLFSRGLLFAPGNELSSEYTKDDPFFSFFELHNQKVFVNKLDALSAQSRNVYPIAIELAPTVIRKLFGETTSLECIKISWVKSLVFRNEKELKRFQFGAFEDVNLQKFNVPLKVDDSIFANVLNLPTVEAQLGCQITQILATRTDREIAFNWSVLSYPNINAEWSTFLQNVNSSSVSNNLGNDYKAVRCINDTIKGGTIHHTDWELSLFEIFLSEIQSNITDGGWAPKEFLDKNANIIENKLKNDFLDFNSEKFNKWVTLIQDILNQDKEFPILKDTKDIILRSLMLLIIYQTPKEILKIREYKDEREIGVRIWNLAMIAAVSCVGMRRLAADLKFFGNKSENIELLNYLIDASTYQLSSQIFHFSKAKPKVSFVASEEHNSFILNIYNKKKQILTRKVSLRSELIKAKADCEYYGFKTSISSPDAFIVTAENYKELAFPVEISTWIDADTATQFLSFAINLTAPKNSIFEAVSSKKRLNRDLLEALMKINFQSGNNCRVSLDDFSNIWVKSDQLLDTMDRDECISSIEKIQKISKDVKRLL